MRIAVFLNPRSRANRRDPGFAERFAGIIGGKGQVLAPGDLTELAAAIDRLAQTPPDIIAVHGGDGTLHRTLSALLRGFGARPLPPIALLAGGTMNVVASSLGILAPSERFLAELAGGAHAGTVTRRCMKIDADYGFVFGNGLMANFLEEYYAPGADYSAARAVWLLGRTFASAVGQGDYARRIFRRFRGRVTVDGEPLPWRVLTGVGAATVREVGLRFKLNHRADDDPDRFSVLALHGGPLDLALQLPAVYRGRGVSERHAWSGLASRLVVESEDPGFAYTVDGDLYRAGASVTVEIGPPITFVRPQHPPRGT